MKKIYLINIPISHNDNRQIQSLGMAYLATDLLKNNFKVTIVDGCGIHADLSIVDIKKEILKDRPDYIGFYVIEFNLQLTLSLINELKSIYSFISFLGGPQASLLGKQIIEQNSCVDLITCGEMDEKISLILNGEREISGLIYKKDGCIIKNDMTNSNCDLNSLPFPIREIDGEIYLTKEIINGKSVYSVPVSSSRGCPFNCTFCSVPAIIKDQKIKWRFRSAENIMMEIQYIYYKYKNIVIRFIDDNFFVDINRALQITESLFKLGGIPFSFSARVDSILKIDEELLILMKKKGLLTVEIGIENFCDTVLTRYQKGHTSLEAIKAINKLRKCGIQPSVDFIMFDPWTTIEELSYNIKILNQEQLTTYYKPFIYHRLYPFPGTIYYKNIDLNNYFINKEVDLIYKKISEFKNDFGPIIDRIIQSDKFGVQKLICLKAPYKLLELLLEDPTLKIKNSEIVQSIISMSNT
jgi:uncharacterized methyltransferase PH0819